MRLNNFQISLANALARSCESVASNLPPEIGSNSIYGFSIYCASGCTSFGVAFSTIEHLESKNFSLNSNDPRFLINKVFAGEWLYINYGFENFAFPNLLADQFYRCLFDGDFEDFAINEDATTRDLDELASKTFAASVADAFLKLKIRRIFERPQFSKDLMMGIQFGDPDANALSMIKLVSSQVNSLSWHKDVMLGCSQLESFRAIYLSKN